jgi:hypothetical protein
MTGETKSPTPAPSWWAELPAIEKAKLWEKVAPGSASRMLDQTDRQVQHMRRLAWAKIAVSVLTILCAFASVVLFVWLATYYINRGAPTQGATIIAALAAVVAAFVGGRAVHSKHGKGH